jgi:hypothetical protein
MAERNVYLGSAIDLHHHQVHSVKSPLPPHQHLLDQLRSLNQSLQGGSGTFEAIYHLHMHQNFPAL